MAEQFLPGSEGGCRGEGGGRDQGGEMTQTMYAHVNKKKAYWFNLLILATWEAEIGSITAQG
jgi:hypothetical protein